jgi:hypothetical protein
MEIFQNLKKSENEAFREGIFNLCTHFEEAAAQRPLSG